MSKQMPTRDPQAQMSQIQRQIQQDWANREYIEVITCSIKKISDFLNSFGKIYNDIKLVSEELWATIRVFSLFP